MKKDLSRRKMLKAAVIIPFGISSINVFSTSHTNPPIQDSIQPNVFGQRPGYTTQMSLLVSMMDWMRSVILREVQGMSTKDLDYLHDKDSNSVGAMLMHLAATERFYQIHTFENRAWGDWDQADADKWNIPSGLGPQARAKINGNSAQYYIDEISAVRETTLEELKNRDDEWLLKPDNEWFWGPTNNWCKWFHVCEHESNHNGQIKWLKGRM
jgi:uncharacterized damage-inducible protein DinB